MKSQVRIWLFFSIFALAALVFSPSAGRGENQPHQVACDVHTGPCSAYLGERKVSLDISPKPVKAMADLTFSVTLTGAQPVASPYIDLGMPGMEMGRNRVILKPLGKGSFQGAGIIVRCPSGRRDWKATVTIPDVGSVEFVFHVLY